MADKRPLEPYSFRERRRQAKAQGTWFSEKPSGALYHEVTQILGPFLGNEDQMARATKIRAGFMEPPTNNDTTLRYANFSEPAWYFHNYVMTKGSPPTYRDIRDVVEKAIEVVVPPEQQDSIAARISEAFWAHGYPFRIKRVLGHFCCVRRLSKTLDVDLVDKVYSLLEDHRFDGVLEEYEGALGALVSKPTTAMVEAGKAFESTMKAIWKRLEPTTDVDQVARVLLEKMATLGLLTPHMREILGLLPNLRNLPGVAHGQGAGVVQEERSRALLMVHLCGTGIVYLVQRLDELYP